MSKLSRGEIADLDKWIEQLKNCQPLEECQVKTLCEKVINNKKLIYSKKFNNFYLNIGQRNIKTRAKCTTGSSPNNNMW